MDNIKSPESLSLQKYMKQWLPEEPVEKIHRPHKVKHGDKWQVKDDDGKLYGTHDTEAEATAQLAALYSAKAREEKA